MKHLKTYNESIKDFLKPKSNERISEKLFKLSSDEILNKSIEFNYLNGFKYLIDNNLVDETTKYLIEKYKLGLHTEEPLKDYEEWFLEQLTNLDVYKSKYNDNFLIHKKKNNILFYYDTIHHTFYYDNVKIYLIFETKFKLKYQQIKFLIREMVEKILKHEISRVVIENIYQKQ